ncbi:MAG: DoxX family protein [Thermoflavifilum sp.]|nr:DoxX family protein [Thermoflavifilum sp.]
MEKAYFSLALIMGIIFLWTGSTKLIFHQRKLERIGMRGLTFLPAYLIKFIGLAELTGSLILILSLFIVLPKWWVGTCSLGFSILMIAATIFHIKRKEYPNVFITLFLLASSLFLLISYDTST